MLKRYDILRIISSVLLIPLLVTLLFALNPRSVLAADMTVISRTPTVNDLDASSNSNIVVTFSSNINDATVTATTFNVDGSLSGQIAGSYSTVGPAVTFNPTSDFNAGETITVTLTTGILSTPAGDALAAPLTWQFTVDVPGGPVALPTGVNFGAGSDDTRSVALGDVNGDGDLDIVVGNEGEQNVVYINDGNGAFTGVNFGAGSDNTYSVVLGDLDGDGDLDIVVGNSMEQNVVYLNDGTGTTWTGVNFSAGNPNTISLALGDVNGDGSLDIVEGNLFEQNVVYLNDGDGTFDTTSVNFGTGGDYTVSVALGDVDGDGSLDIVVGNISTQNVVYLNDGDGAFDTNSVNFGTGSDSTYSVALGDMDGDGDLDIVVGNNAAQNVVYLNDGDGTFDTTSVNFGTGSDATWPLALGDMNGDGALDIVVGNDTEQNVVYLNDGDGTFDTTSVNFGAGSENTASVALGDVNGDGTLDIVTGNWRDQNVVYFNGIPEISIEGNSTEIVSGDNSPNSADHTDFGSAAVSGGTVNRTFTIKNIGDTLLSMTGSPKVSLSGSSDFSVSVQPTSPVAASGSTTFTVHFDPSTTGVRSATVSLINNDSNENPYTFSIQGTGTVPGDSGPNVGGNFTPVNRQGMIMPWLFLIFGLVVGGTGMILRRRRGRGKVSNKS